VHVRADSLPIVHRLTAYAGGCDPLLDDELPKFPELLPSMRDLL
jgi:hypothetical protein